jgi:hypothetical protein
LLPFAAKLCEYHTTSVCKNEGQRRPTKNPKKDPSKATKFLANLVIKLEIRDGKELKKTLHS